MISDCIKLCGLQVSIVERNTSTSQTQIPPGSVIKSADISLWVSMQLMCVCVYVYVCMCLNAL